MNTEKVIKRDQKYIMHTYARSPLVLEHGEGMYAYDADGRAYLDFTSGIGVNALGYCHPAWVRAVADQAATLQHTSNLYYTAPDGKLAKKLCRRTGLDAVFFGNSGAEANEGAIKCARKYSVDTYGESRNKVITLVNSFHGRTLATLTATGQDVFHHDFGPFPGNFDYVPAGDFAALEKAADKDTCAVMMELVQGEGGVVALDADYVARVAAFCREKDILVIVDEVQTGVGRTGKFLACEHFDLHPDIPMSERNTFDLKANPDRKATGSIIESTLDKGRGYVATVLVHNGTLKMGDIVLAGTNHGRVKAMFNERNVRIDEAGPSAPVQILGLNGAPQAGDIFHVLDTEQEAREIANKREQLQRELGLRTHKLLTLDDIGRRIAIGNFQELNIIVKGDVDGSVEALGDSLIKLSTDEIQINVLHKAVGQISESDITLAAASNAIIVGFQVRPSMAARRLAEKEGVDIRLYSIIYDAIEEVKAAMEGMLSPDIKEEITGTAEVRETYHISKVGTVAGCAVKEGKLRRSSKIRLIRDGIVIYSGDLGSLKRFKDDVKEVATGYECGLNITNYNDIKVGDLVEAYEEIEVKKTL